MERRIFLSNGNVTVPTLTLLRDDYLLVQHCAADNGCKCNSKVESIEVLGEPGQLYNFLTAMALNGFHAVMY